MTLPRIIITPGEPAGIGPDIALAITQDTWPAELVFVCDPTLMQDRAKQLGYTITFEKWDLEKKSVTPHIPGIFRYIPVNTETTVTAGQLNPLNAAYVLRCLEIAAQHCMNQSAHALVTGPVHKANINAANIPFTGHTEFLANYCHASHPLMLFVVDKLRVALATTHLPLSQVPAAIQKNELKKILRLLHSELQQKFGIMHPHIVATGLNPHAGESGHLGREEIDTIEPALAELREENMHLTGPLPADTLFTEKYLKNADAVLAMYHDQALPVVKYMSFGHAVNITLGLPIIRTSVDHGTAIDIAGTPHSDAGSLRAAIKLAIQLAQPLIGK